METTRKFLYTILSQYPNRPYGSKNEELVISSIKNELHKTCDIVEEEQIKFHPYLSKFKWMIISFYFTILIISGLLHPLALFIISIIGTCCHFLLFDLQASWFISLFPGIKTTNLFGQINCLDHEHCFNEKTILFVGHIDNCFKEKGTISHILSMCITSCLYLLCILSCIGYIYGKTTGNYLFSPFVSIISLILLVCSMSLYGKGKVNKVSGLTTTSCLLQLSSYFKHNNISLLKSTNIAFFITPIHSERNEEISHFVKSFSNRQKQQLENTIVICLDELDDPETLTCYKYEGIFDKRYSERVMNALKDASQQEDVFLTNKTKMTQSTKSIAKIFRKYFTEVVPIDAKCHPMKQILREEKEHQVKKDDENIFIHDDQIDCVNQCVKMLKRYIESIDFVIEMKQIIIDDETIGNNVELEMNTFENKMEKTIENKMNQNDEHEIEIEKTTLNNDERNILSNDNIDIKSIETLQIDNSHDSGEDSIEL